MLIITRKTYNLKIFSKGQEPENIKEMDTQLSGLTKMNLRW